MSKTFLEVAEIFEKIEGIASRNEMTSVLADFFKTLSNEESQIVSYMVLGRISPMFVKSEFNYSEKSFVNLIESMTKSTDIKFNVKKSREDTGDIGLTVKEFSEKMNYKTSNILLADLYSKLWDFISISGNGAVEKKNEKIYQLIKKCSPLENKFLGRLVCGDLRLGLNDRTLLDVYSFVLVGDKGMREEIEKAYGVSADIGYIAQIISEKDIEAVRANLKKVLATPGIPILSRLVERVHSFEEVFERIGNDVLVQPKYDGLRCQIHKYSEDKDFDNGVVWRDYSKKNEESYSTDLFGGEDKNEKITVKLFTRNLEDVTDMFPEVVQAAKEIDIESFILDSEVLGWNYKDNTFLSYQDTMQRRRKYNVVGKMDDIPVQAFVFDVLYNEGISLTQKDTVERIEILEEKYSKYSVDGIKIAKTDRVNGVDDLKKIYEEYVKEGLEGIIVKQFEGGYTPGVRNYEWIKMKKSMDKGMVDTVDLVVVGYYRGSGRRTSLGLGALLGALYNQKEDRFDAICKVGTGLNDENIVSISGLLNEISLKERPKDVVVIDNLKPDIWVEPKYVMSVEADEITKNLNAKEEIGGGYSLRFPRLIEFGRDKSPSDATSVEELKNY